MRNSRKLLFIILILMPLLVLVGFSSWIIMFTFEFGPSAKLDPVSSLFKLESSTVYNGEEQVPLPVNDIVIPEENISYQFKIIGDEEYTSEKPVDAGTYEVIISLSSYTNNDLGILNLTGNCKVKFTIEKKQIQFKNNIIELNYGTDNSVLTTSTPDFETIQEKIISNINFTDSSKNDVVFNSNILFLDGIDNGVDYYDYTNKTVKIKGSTYIVDYSLVNTFSKNYDLVGDTNLYFKYKTVICESELLTIEDALSSSSSTIRLSGNATNSSSYVETSFTTINNSSGDPFYGTFNHNLSKKTLVVSFEDSSSINRVDSSLTNNVYSVLTIPKIITLTVNESSTLGVGSSYTLSAIKQRGVLMNEGTIMVKSGGKVESYGYLKGHGELIAESGAAVLDFMKLYDWPGGSAALAMYSDVFPSNCWSLHNISCTMIIKNGGVYKGYFITSLNIPLLGEKNLDTTFTIIGKTNETNALFKPTDNSSSNYVKKYPFNNGSNEYNELFTITGSNQKDGQRDVIELSGNYTDLTMKIEVSYGISVTMQTSKEKALPISSLDIIVKENSNFHLTSSDYLFLPGTKILIEEGAYCYIGEGVDLSIETYENLNKILSSTEGQREYFNYFPSNKNKDAIFIVNGTMEIDGNIGGTISSTSTNAIIKLTGNIKSNYNSLYHTGSPYYFNNSCYANGILYENGSLSSVNQNLSLGGYVSIVVGDSIGWLKSSGMIVYNPNGGSLEPDRYEITLPYEVFESDMPTPSREHYIFNGWYSSPSCLQSEKVTYMMAYNSITLYAGWTPIEYNINIEYAYDYFGSDFIDTNVNNITNQPLTYNASINGTLKTPVHPDGYIFGGWYTDKSCTTPLGVLVGKDYAPNDLNIYGLWYPDNIEFFNVSFDFNNTNTDSTLLPEATKVVSVAVNSFIAGLETYNTYNNDLNYTLYFDGWYSDIDYSNKISNNTEFYDGMIIYGKWIEKGILTIKTSNKLSDETYTIYYIGNYKMLSYDDYFSKSISDYPYDGLIFDSWNSNNISDGYINMSSNQSYVVEAYIKKTVELTVDLAGGSGVSSPFVIDFIINNDDYISKTIGVPTQNGKEFDDWELSCDGAEISDNTITIYITTAKSGKITAKWSSNCIPSGTLITLANGSIKKVEDLTLNDLLLVFNHETGKFEASPIVFIDDDGWKEYNIVNLKFSNGTITRLIYEHGYFDVTLNKYVYVDEYNYRDFIGHEFVYTNGEMLEYVTLVDSYITTEYVGCYSPVTAVHLNYIVDGMLSMPGGIEGIFNIFEYGDDLMFDEALMKADIEKYGIMEYEVLAPYVPYEMYIAFNAKYFNVAIGKGYITFDEILYYAEKYLDRHGLRE